MFQNNLSTYIRTNWFKNNLAYAQLSKSDASYRRKTHFLLLIAMLLFSVFGNYSKLNAQTFDTDFGKNRVQYHTSIWSSYEADNSVVYFYQGGQDIARYALQYIENELPKIEEITEHSLASKLQVMVYHNHADAIQTNIGIGLQRNNQGGITEVIGNKVFVYYQGDYKDLEKQLNEGIAKAIVDNMIMGSSVQEIVQNAVLLELPNWFKNGLIAYIADPWNTEKSSELKRYLDKNRLRNFNKLFPYEETLAGHALWYYIEQVYGQNAISNILYVTRVNRSIDAGFGFVTGKDARTLVKEWRASVIDEYEYDEVVRDSLFVGEENQVFASKKRFRKATLNDFKVSPDGKYIAYSHNENGLLRVFLYNKETGKRKRLLRTNFKTYELPIQENYPLLAWDKRSKKIAIVYEKRDVVYLETHNLDEDTKEVAEITKFQQITGIAFTNNSQEMVLSGTRNGTTDLYLYNIPNTKTTRLTNDVYDDLSPRFAEIDGQRGVLFVSNRPDDTLEELKMDSLLSQQLTFEDFDVFFYQFDNEAQQLVQISDTDFANEKLPLAASDSTFAFLSDENGIYNIYSGGFDSVFVKNDTIITYQDSIITNPNYLVDFSDSLILETEFLPRYKKIGKYTANTNQKRNIDFWDLALKGNKILTTSRDWKRYPMHEVGAYQVFKNNYADLDKTPYLKYELLQARTAGFASNKKENKTKTLADLINEAAAEEGIDVIVENDTVEIEEDGVYFQSDLDFWDISEPNSEGIADGNFGEADTLANGERFNTYGNEFNPNLLYRNSKARVYKTRFAVDYVAGQLDDSSPDFYQTTGTFFNELNKVPEGASATFADNSGEGQLATFRMGVSDLFEDYKLIGTLKIPVSNFSSYVIGVEFQNLKKRIDKSWLIQRRKDVEFVQGYPIPDFPNLVEANKKIVSTIVQNTLTYPIDITRSIRLKTAIRNDKHIPLTEYVGSVFFQSTSENLASLKLEYVFDNTIELGVNLREGMRYKIYTEYNKPFLADLSDSNFDFSMKDTGYIGLAGFDIRHYYKVHRKIIWANRLATGISFGPKRIMYYLGDVDGTLIPLFDQNTPVKAPNNAEYILEAAAPNLRGFRSNVRNGSKFAIFSSELKVPVFSYLFARPLKSQFISDFQVIGFFDAGTAWENGSPFSEENRFYTYTYPDTPQANDPVVTTVQYFKNPIVYGYGFGFRSTLLGYYLKLDIGWGVDSGYRNKARWHLSIGYDF